jgi:hypothetical protein
MRFTYLIRAPHQHVVTRVAVAKIKRTVTRFSRQKDSYSKSAEIFGLHVKSKFRVTRSRDLILFL